MYNQANNMAALKQIDRSQSKKIKKLLRAHPNECYRNAFRAFYKLPNAKYVEGWVKWGNMYIPHAWVLLDDKIIDPTRPEMYDEYRSGIEYSTAEIEEAKQKIIKKFGTDEWLFPLGRYEEKYRLVEKELPCF